MSFKEAMKYTFYWEGKKLENNPNDPGGLTNFGIILPVLKDMGLAGDFDLDGDVDADDLKLMDEEKATAVYKEQFWKRYKCGFLEYPISIKYFDTAVNLGPYQAGLILQRAINASHCSYCSGKLLKVDGIVGPITRKAINVSYADEILVAFKSEQAGVYRMIVYKKPEMDEFLNGWLRRAYSVPGDILEVYDVE